MNQHAQRLNDQNAAADLNPFHKKFHYLLSSNVTHSKLSKCGSFTDVTHHEQINKGDLIRQCSKYIFQRYVIGKHYFCWAISSLDLHNEVARSCVIELLSLDWSPQGNSLSACLTACWATEQSQQRVCVSISQHLNQGDALWHGVGLSRGLLGCRAAFDCWVNLLRSCSLYVAGRGGQCLFYLPNEFPEWLVGEKCRLQTDT